MDRPIPTPSEPKTNQPDDAEASAERLNGQVIELQQQLARTASEKTSTTETRQLCRDLVRAFVERRLNGESAKIIAKQIATDPQWTSEHREQLRLKAVESLR